MELSEKQVIRIIDFLSGRFKFVSDGWYKYNKESVIEDTFKFIENLTKHNNRTIQSAVRRHKHEGIRDYDERLKLHSINQIHRDKDTDKYHNEEIENYC